ncbi:hypothetical protein NDU88_002098 [Pleurodeles waltl]|uniref:Uncharacterized protein n=1 Tax=Pleurodeles waltl TaxID=8319 RepID=A0AAV7R916_PLEWA|nr:hypothetical protein NDU88_002098 [Pleurodeles waltl]
MLCVARARKRPFIHPAGVRVIHELVLRARRLLGLSVLGYGTMAPSWTQQARLPAPRANLDKRPLMKFSRPQAAGNRTRGRHLTCREYPGRRACRGGLWRSWKPDDVTASPRSETAPQSAQ